MFRDFFFFSIVQICHIRASTLFKSEIMCYLKIFNCEFGSQGATKRIAAYQSIDKVNELRGNVFIRFLHPHLTLSQ